MDSFVIEQTRLGECESLELLQSFDQFFHPCLSTLLDLKDFAVKLAQNANWILCKSKERTVAYMAFYRNYETHVDYIASYCEIPANNHNLERVLHFLINNTPSCISETRFRCRKERLNDINLFEGLGFNIIEDLGENYMLKRLNS